MNRPEKKNALSGDMLAGLVLGYEYIDDDPEIRCAILTGAGGNFSSGADLVAMGQQSDDPKVQEVMARGNNPHWKALLRDYRLSKPLIAAVEGYAVAGGTEILQGTDIRVAGESAIFGVWEAKRGLFPLGGSACRLPRQIPYTQAMDILLRVPADPRARSARRSGLIGHVVPDGHALDGRASVAAAGRGERAAVDEGDPARVARDRAHERLRRDAAPGHDRLGGLRERGRAGRPEGVRARSAPPELQGQVTAVSRSRARASRLARRSRHPNAPRSRTSIRALIDAAMTIEDVDAATLLDDRARGRPAHGPARRRPRRRRRATSPREPRRLPARARPIVGEASPLSPRIDWESVDDDGASGRGPGHVRRGVRGSARLRARRLDRVRVRRDARHREHRGRAIRA